MILVEYCTDTTYSAYSDAAFAFSLACLLRFFHATSCYRVLKEDNPFYNFFEQKFLLCDALSWFVGDEMSVEHCAGQKDTQYFLA
jgi:hypothetical protein